MQSLRHLDYKKDSALFEFETITLLFFNGKLDKNLNYRKSLFLSPGYLSNVVKETHTNSFKK